MTHTELINIGAKFLLGAKNDNYRCTYVIKDLVTMCLETPDVFGFNGGCNILLEVKVGRGDFLADKKKIFRANESLGIGGRRYYLCPEGLIKESEVPINWGLMYCNEKNKIKVIKNSNKFENKNNYGEQQIMYSLIRRLTEGKRQVFDFKK